MARSKIACGMYAPTDALQDCWRSLVQQFSINSPGFSDETFEPVFRTDSDIYLEDDVFIGQTCGYPYIKTWQPTHSLLCVPIFDFEGCQEKEYSSWFISHKDNSGESLQDFKNKTVAINGYNSNSGMNVLRYKVSQIADGAPFFSEVVVSGSHSSSIEMVSSRTVDLAAIDAVTYALSEREQLFDPDNLKMVGQSEFTSGLPFIALKELGFDKEEITSSFNHALEKMDQLQRSRLGLIRFNSVQDEDYRKIRDMEAEALRLGYPELA